MSAGGAARNFSLLDFFLVFVFLSFRIFVNEWFSKRLQQHFIKNPVFVVKHNLFCVIKTVSNVWKRQQIQGKAEI